MPPIRKTGERRLTLDLGGVPVPVRIITERGRRSTTASVRQRALYIRLPHALGPADRDKRLAEMVDWAHRTARENPEAFRHFLPPVPAAEYSFGIGEAEYRITVEVTDRAGHKIEATGDHRLGILLGTRDTRLIPKLLAKYFGALQLPLVTDRVNAINARYFRKPIREVRLSNTYSRWGSCSHRGNINLATRLLLAPPEVLDAVIVHELAHLVEANHSARFWAEVERVLPEHKVYDEWLRRHGNALRFDPVAIR